MINKWRVSLIVVPLVTLVLGGVPVSAQDAGGIAQCLVGCAKSDKPCQDSCLPAATASAHACLALCRRKAKNPDLVIHLKLCIGQCLHRAGLTN